MNYHPMTKTPEIESSVEVTCEVCGWRFVGKGRGTFATAVARAHVLRNATHECDVAIHLKVKRND